MRSLVRLAIVGVLAALLPAAAGAYAEFQVFVQETSGRYVNCAMCHTHPDGPDGLKPGQIGRLDAEELQKLNRARAAFEPGQKVDSPILNEFGEHIMEKLGKTQFIALRRDPGKLAEALGRDSDLDGDGIPDADEYLAGTHPLDSRHGDPWKLLVHNFRGQIFHIVMILLATILGLFGLNNLLRWFGQQMESDEANMEEHGSAHAAEETRREQRTAPS